MSSYHPDNWCLVEIHTPTETLYKVFAEWRGGFADGDQWRLNSGVTRIEEDEYFYYFYGDSGSVYECMKDGYGIRSPYNQSVLNTMIEKAPDAGATVKAFEEMPSVSSLLL